MKWNSASAVSLLTGVFAALGAGLAHADPPSACAALAVEADAGVRERWPDLAAEIREAFETRGDVDACARIELVVVGPIIVLKVILPDGRSASRSVSHGEDVLPALEGLLLLPMGATSVVKSGSASSAPPPAAASVDPELRPTDAPVIGVRGAAGPSIDRPTPFRIELAVGAGARAGDGLVGAGAGVASFLDITHWLIGFQGRIDRYQPFSGGMRTMALELVALGGRRFGLGASSTLDLVAGPALALHATTTMVTQTSSTGVATSQTNSDQGLPRLILGSRLSFGAHSLLRTFVQMDADLGISIGSTSASSTNNGPPPAAGPLPEQAGLPAWTVGVAVGAAVGTR